MLSPKVWLNTKQERQYQPQTHLLNSILIRKMVKYKIIITPKALKDMDLIYQYIANVLLVPEIALAQYNRIAKAILALESFPNKNPFFMFQTANLKNIRFLIVDHYMVFYKVEGNLVVILRVLYGKRDIEKILDSN